MKWLRRIVIGLVVLVVVAYAGGMAALYFLQREFQYDPVGKVLALNETTLSNAELISIETGGGGKLGGWYQAPQPGKPLIVFYKGNWNTFTEEDVRYEAFVADGYGFLAFDYRGFPASPGQISEANILEDSLAVFDWAQARGFPIVLWGRSLGTGPATYVASKRDADALFLETPYDSTVSVGQERYWFFPVGLLMLDQFRLDLWIPDVKEPVFVALAGADKTIPPHHGQRAYELAPNKAGISIEEGAGHSDLWDRGIWVNQARQFFEDVEAKLGR
ncbi:MAG: alpha/beta hydrolase [Devosia sp.]